MVSPPLDADENAAGAGADIVQSSELAVMVAVALDLPACLEPNMLIDGFAFITPVLPIMIGQVPMIAARPGTQRQRAGRPRAARGYFLSRLSTTENEEIDLQDATCPASQPRMARLRVRPQ